MTPVSHGGGIEPCFQSLTWVGFDPWRPQSGSDLLLHKHFETVVFEEFCREIGKGKK